MKPNTERQPVVSVIVPVLNNRDGLVHALNSLGIENQLLEVIVIDGGSVDGTVDEIICRDKNIAYWETGKDQGIADAFNRGIARAKGEYIAILNSDDYWLPNTLRRFLVAHKEQPQADIFYGAVRYVDPVSGYAYTRSPRLNAMKYRMWLFHPAMFVRRSSYLRIGLYDPAFTHAMDSEWCHRAMAMGERFVEVPSVLANMSLRGVSDREYRISLKQYRDSLIKNKVCSKLEAHFYCFFFSSLKRLMLQRWMYPLKLLRDKLVR